MSVLVVLHTAVGWLHQQQQDTSPRRCILADKAIVPGPALGGLSLHPNLLDTLIAAFSAAIVDDATAGVDLRRT